MPKTKETVPEFLQRVLRDFPGVFSTDNSILFFQSCECPVSADKIFSVNQHIATQKHQNAEQRKKASTSTQRLLSDFQRPQSINPFHMDLCKAFLEANIPLNKVTNPSIKLFLEKYTSKAIPSDTLLRQKCVPVLYNECIESLRAKAENKYIWVSVDETTDSEQRLVVNFIFGILDGEEDSAERGKSYLLNVGLIDAQNASNVAAFFNDSVSLLWPNGKYFSCNLASA